MLVTRTKERVRYNEVDQMGYLHHGNFAAYFEIGRTQLMRENGIVYKDMEAQGFIMPLSEFHVKFHEPVRYDEEIVIETTLAKFSGVRLLFEYKVFNEAGRLAAEGNTPLVLANAQSGKPTRPPKDILNIIGAFFQ